MLKDFIAKVAAPERGVFPGHGEKVNYKEQTRGVRGMRTKGVSRKAQHRAESRKMGRIAMYLGGALALVLLLLMLGSALF